MNTQIELIKEKDEPRKVSTLYISISCNGITVTVPCPKIKRKGLEEIRILVEEVRILVEEANKTK